MISFDGYSSTSMDEKIARYFASKSDTSDGKQIVLLKLRIENESGKHYFPLDSSEFTLYPDEKEVLLQAGIVAKVCSVVQEE